MSFFDLLKMVGGLALFLYGMNLLGDGLSRASGGRLERILEKLTNNPLKAVLMGAVVTGVIQSSSATTVMVVGFVNSGIMSLKQAVGIIMGANIGTTVTSWILSLTGIESDAFWIRMLKPSSFSPILAIVGVGILLFSHKDKLKNAATILVGFAILMFGMDSMSAAVSPLAEVPEFTNLLIEFQNPVFGVLAGLILTAVIQSSSASVEVLTGFILRDMFGFDVTNQDLALIGQYSENKFNGVNCGIMDQFAIAMGKAGHAIFLDTATLKYEYAPIKLENAKIVISCSNKKRGLGDSKYNERRSECEKALAELQKVVSIDALGDLTEAQFEEHKDAIKEEVCVRRAKHAVYENQRTIKAVEALKNNDVALFGKLMNESHVSLRDDYEVTGIELDTLVEEAWKIDGVIGSRMTGAGFGGCTVSIVKDEAVDTFIKEVGAAYEKKIGYAADFYVVEIGDGPVKLA